MAAFLICYSKVQLLHRKTEIVAIVEAKVWKVPKNEDYPEGIKYSLFLILKETGEIVFGFDNHKPKGHHMHRRGLEKDYDFTGTDTLVDEFWDLVEKEGFQT